MEKPYAFTPRQLLTIGVIALIPWAVIALIAYAVWSLT